MINPPKVIVIGAGNWGKNLVRNFYELASLAGIVEVNADLRQAMSRLYPEIPTYTEIPSDLDYQGVVIATPASTHYHLAKSALYYGKDVFVEKPMTLQASQAQELAVIAEQQQRILMVGHLLLYQPAIVWLKEYIQQGKMGKVHHISAQRANLGTVRTGENALWSLGVHDIAVILYLLDYPQLQELAVQGDRFLQSGQEDNVHLHLHFANGCSAHVHSSWFWYDRCRQTVILGEQKMAVYDEIQQTLMVYTQHIDTCLRPQKLDQERINVASSEPLKLECEHFLQCMHTRQRPVTHAQSGVAVVEILELAQQKLYNNC